jgi:hypothetical protein
VVYVKDNKLLNIYIGKSGQFDDVYEFIRLRYRPYSIFVLCALGLGVILERYVTEINMGIIKSADLINFGDLFK